MRSPHGLDIVENCGDCKLKIGSTFCNLSSAALQALEAVTYAAAYPKGAVLFVDGQAPRGVFVLCKGRVKLSVVSPGGKTLILKIIESGEILGLSAIIGAWKTADDLARS